MSLEIKFGVGFSRSFMLWFLCLKIFGSSNSKKYIFDRIYSRRKEEGKRNTLEPRT